MALRTYPVSKSEYGQFSPDATEYVVTEPDLARPWLNLLANGKYQIWLSQTLGGMSLYNQDLRINNYYGKFDTPGKYVFLRDEDTGKYWSANWVPFFRPLQFFRCVHGMNYSTLTTETRGVRTSIRVFLPLGEACEVWTVTVENRSKKPRRLSVYPYVQWRLACFIRADNEHEWFSEADFHERENCIVAKYRDPHRLEVDFEGFLGSSLPVRGYDCSDRAFYGTFYNRYRKSAVLERGKCTNSRGYSEQTIGCLRHKLTLRPGQAKTFQVVMGYSSVPAERRKLIRRYSDPANVEKAFRKNRAHWERLIEQIHVKTPDAIFDRTVNVRLKYQTWMCILWCRSGSLRFGYRDILQDSRGVLAANPDYTRERFLEPLRYQYKSGRAVRQWSRSSDNHDTRPYMDSHLWIVYTLAAYIKETGDTSILKVRVPWMDGGSDTVLGHALRGLDYSWKMRGSHGLQLILGGDINDAFDKVGDEGRGESVWISQFYYGMLRETERLAEFIHDKKLAATCRRRAAAVRKAVSRFGWDGEWYRRCYDDNGKPVGSKRNRDAKIHIMTQMWGALSGVGTRGRDVKAMDAVERYLRNDFGYEIFTPPYRKKDPDIGQFSALTGFMNNNNYVHHNAMKMGADIKLGRGDLAYETFRKMLPSNPRNNPAGPRVEPYAYANCIISSRHDRAGESEIGWVTGATSWWFTVTTEWMMGAIPDYEGLRIDPCLPRKWRKVQLRRPFRGAVYEITVKNPAGVQ
ncbi:MAG TPA: hypothetical protein VMZ92_21625, partial [Planctomycetota bacterium]|nr:hypothetical protein [Planctomycetota bacterium]